MIVSAGVSIGPRPAIHQAQAVEATQRLGLLPERRELEAEPPELQLPKGSPAA